MCEREKGRRGEWEWYGDNDNGRTGQDRGYETNKCKTRHTLILTKIGLSEEGGRTGTKDEDGGETGGEKRKERERKEKKKKNNTSNKNLCLKSKWRRMINERENRPRTSNTTDPFLFPTLQEGQALVVQ